MRVLVVLVLALAALLHILIGAVLVGTTRLVVRCLW